MPRRAATPPAATLALAAVAAGGCTAGVVRAGHRALDEPGRAAIGTGRDMNASMIYAARTSAGVIVVDLGWWGAEGALRDALRRVGAEPRDVVAVFLTHSHRDHVGAWRLVSHAPFYVAAAESPRLRGAVPHRGWVPRVVDWLRPPSLPRRGEVAVRAIGRDTAVVVGADTVRAFLVPGHTAGSTAYLVRGVLFVGDALSDRVVVGGLRPARGGYSDDTRAARASLAPLARAAAPFAPRLVCTAHARCEPATAALWRRLGVPDEGAPPATR
jgi:glyoxylase-like metal-dependent hydrolase (beta-lactamase superfamily II)